MVLMQMWVTGICSKPAYATTGLASRYALAMRISSARTQGFSLLELLVVTVIIGILVTMFTLSVGLTGGDRELEREADRLRALITAASEDALLQGRDIGLSFVEHGYEFSGQDPNANDQWRPLMLDDVLRPRELDPSIELVLEIEGREVELREPAEQLATNQPADQAESDPADEDYLPQVFIFSSGEIDPPFELRLRRQFSNDVILISTQDDSSVELSRENF